MPHNATKTIFSRLESRLIKNPRKTAFFLGAITYFLPCGFTQTVQIYALGLANPVSSALAMGIFALGTVPMLMAIGFVGSFTKSSYYPLFTKVMGVIVLLVGISYFGNFLNLYGVRLPIFSIQASNSVSVDPNVTLKNGIQEVIMSVNSRGYTPNSFTVKSGVPVRWIVNGENVFGCQSFLQAPKVNIQATLRVGENILEFTPKEKGQIAFSCSMGMFQGVFNVI